MIFRNTETGEFGVSFGELAARLGLPLGGLKAILEGRPPQHMPMMIPDIAPWQTYAETGPPETPIGKVAVEVAPVDGQQVWTVQDSSTDLADLRAAVLAVVADQRWRTSLTFTFNDTPGVASDDQAQNRAANTLALLSQPEADGVKVQWEITPGAFLALDKEGVRQLGLAMGLHVQACWSYAAALAAQAMAATTPAEIALINPAAGWPA